MRIVIQKVKEAAVHIDGNEQAKIAQGLLVLVGITPADTEADADWLSKKVANLRVFDDEQGVMNRSLLEVDGELLIVSQFTLMASYKKGNRPSYIHAAPPDIAIPLYEYFCSQMEKEIGKRVQTGVFGADMKVSLINDGPVTICMDTHHKE